MRLTVAVIGILSEYDDFCICKTRVVKRIEDCKHIRIDALRAVLCDEELAQFPIVRLRHLICKEFLPVIFKNFLCHAKLSRMFQKHSLFRYSSPSGQSRPAAAKKHLPHICRAVVSHEHARHMAEGGDSIPRRR